MAVGENRGAIYATTDGHDAIYKKNDTAIRILTRLLPDMHKPHTRVDENAKHRIIPIGQRT